MTKLHAAERVAEQAGTFGPVRDRPRSGRDSRATGRGRAVGCALLAGDAVAVALALVVAGPFALKSASAGEAACALIAPFLWLLLFAACGLYSREGRRVSNSTLDELPSVLQANVLGAVLVFGLAEAVLGEKHGAGQIALLAAVAAGAMLALRLVARVAARRLFERERALLVADGPLAEVIARKLSSHPEYALDPIGLLTSDEVGEPNRLPVLGDLPDLAEVAERHGVSRIVLAGRHLDAQEELELLRNCRELELKVAFVPHPFEVLGQSVEVDDIEGLTVLAVNPPVLSLTSRVLKRALDIIGALGGLVLFSPVMLLTAIAIKVDSAGPVLFRQPRVGRQGKTFYLLKFRSMFSDAEDRVDELRARSKDPHWLHLEHDPRITRVGLLLRLTSLDELPQLWNVLKGEMSLVGPRPLIPSEDELILGHDRARLKLLPGLTGLWQVLGRTTIPFEEMVSLDYLYVVNWSLWGDLKLIFRTIPVVLRRSGAN